MFKHSYKLAQVSFCTTNEVSVKAYSKVIVLQSLDTFLFKETMHIFSQEQKQLLLFSVPEFQQLVAFCLLSCQVPVMLYPTPAKPLCQCWICFLHPNSCMLIGKAEEVP